MTTKIFHLRLESDAVETLDKLAGTSLNRQAIARMLLIAAIEAVQANGGKIQLPPKFTVAEDAPFSVTGFRVNEAKPDKKR
jgi:hypothetical protein